MPGHVGSRQAVGWCRVLQQDLSAARAHFEHTLAMDRNFAENHGALAVMDVLRGRPANAVGLSSSRRDALRGRTATSAETRAP